MIIKGKFYRKISLFCVGMVTPHLTEPRTLQQKHPTYIWQES
jgi:hypothetical protein